MKKTKLTIGVFMGVAAILTAMTWFGAEQASAYPKPAFVPAPEDWQLDLQLHGEPESIWVALPGEAKPKRFWYLLYTITNNTSKDVEYYPAFDLMTDTLKLYSSGVGVRRPVFEAIRQRYNSTLPLLEPENMVSGKILQGPDNARSSAVIFADFDPNAATAEIFIEGLSNETISVESPAQGAQAKPVLLRKTLMLQYQVIGDKENPEYRAMLYRDRKWIMR